MTMMVVVVLVAGDDDDDVAEGLEEFMIRGNGGICILLHMSLLNGRPHAEETMIIIEHIHNNTTQLTHTPPPSRLKPAKRRTTEKGHAGEGWCRGQEDQKKDATGRDGVWFRRRDEEGQDPDKSREEDREAN